MIEILNSTNQTQDFDQELIKEIKNIFKNEIQSNILLLIRGIYRVKANEQDLSNGVYEISKSFWNNSMQSTLFSIDFDSVFKILAQHQLTFYPKFYFNILSRLEIEIS
jgi:hypothetical protein